MSASHMLLIVLPGCCHFVTPSPGDNDASHDNDNDNDNASDNDSDAVLLTPESQVWAAAVTPSVRIHHGVMGTTPILLWEASR